MNTTIRWKILTFFMVLFPTLLSAETATHLKDDPEQQTKRAVPSTVNKENAVARIDQIHRAAAEFPPPFRKRG